MDPNNIRKGTIFRELYYLTQDPGKQRNVVTEQPELASEPERKLDTWVEGCTDKHDNIHQGQHVYMEMPAAYEVSIQISEDFDESRLMDRLDQDFVPACPVPVRIYAGGPQYVDG